MNKREGAPGQDKAPPKETAEQKRVVQILVMEIDNPVHYMWPETYIERRDELVKAGIFKNAEEINSLPSIRQAAANNLYKFALGANNTDNDLKAMKEGWKKAGFNPVKIEERVKEGRDERKTEYGGV